MILRAKDLPELQHLEAENRQEIAQRAAWKSRTHLLLPGLTVAFGLFLGTQFSFLQTSLLGFVVWIGTFFVFYGLLYVLLLNTVWRWFVQKEVDQHGLSFDGCWHHRFAGYCGVTFFAHWHAPALPGMRQPEDWCQ